MPRGDFLNDETRIRTGDITIFSRYGGAAHDGENRWKRSRAIVSRCGSSEFAIFPADSEGGALLRPSYSPNVLTARAVHAGGSEAGRSAPAGVRVASDAPRSHRNEGSGPVEPWAISRKLDHDDATKSTTSRAPRQRPGSTRSKASPDHSRAFRSIETRCRVTPKRSAICSIVRPSA